MTFIIFRFTLKKIRDFYFVSCFLFNFIITLFVKNLITISIMSKFQKEILKIRLLRLATLRCTGSPADLALRFEISERHVKRIIKEMRDNGTDIKYSQSRRSYVTGEEYQ
jgi:biotin operon repressor